MSDAHALIAECRRLDIHICAVNGSLRINAPRDSMTPQLMATLKAHKPELLAILTAPPAEPEFSERAAVREYDGGFPRDEAERLAALDCSPWDAKQAAEIRHAAVRRVNRAFPTGRTITDDEWQTIDRYDNVIQQAFDSQSLSAVTTACEVWAATVTAMFCTEHRTKPHT